MRMWVIEQVIIEQDRRPRHPHPPLEPRSYALSGVGYGSLTGGAYRVHAGVY